MLLVDVNYILKNGIPPVDYHLHSSFSDGQGTPEDYVISAMKKGLKEIALTEHVWKTSQWLLDYIGCLRNLRQHYHYPILIGVESKAINLKGEIDLNDRWRPQLDLVMGVVHRLPSENDYTFFNPLQLSPEKAALIETEAIVNMVKKGGIDVLGHPTLAYYRYYGEKQLFPIGYIEEIVRAAKRYNVPLEITGSWCNDYRLLEIAFQEEALISFGSGAHSPQDVGKINKDLVCRVLKKLYPNIRW